MYRAGVRGTVVEPNPYLIILWKVFRRQDNFLKLACSNNEFETLLMFDHSAPSNTLDSDFAMKISKNQEIQIQESRTVACMSLQNILFLHQKIFPGDFILDLDIEGRDLEVLKTYDFNTAVRPFMILVEDVPPEDQNLSTTDTTTFLNNSGYVMAGRTVITSIFIDLEHPIARVLSY